MGALLICIGSVALVVILLALAIIVSTHAFREVRNYRGGF